MKIVIDDKIPYIREVISQITSDALYIKGTDICHDDLIDADALIIRTRTHCDAALLKGTNVKFIATATIGFDHIDTQYLKQAHISWMNCPGCNAASVEQYVHAVLLLLKRERKADLTQLTIGIVGCGHVGSKVAIAAKAEGMKVLVCDPLRQEKGDTARFTPANVDNGKRSLIDHDDTSACFVSMETIQQQCDIISFHVPMVKEGKYPTLHLANDSFFKQLKKQPVIINTSRGAVIDNTALLHALHTHQVADAVIDTWENEPHINLQLLDKVWIGTPHIAGYSADGKVNADNMVIEGLCQFFNINHHYHIAPPSLPSTCTPHGTKEEQLLQLYNPINDSKHLKANPEKFEWLRGNYPLRRETFSK